MHIAHIPVEGKIVISIVGTKKSENPTRYIIKKIYLPEKPSAQADCVSKMRKDLHNEGLEIIEIFNGTYADATGILISGFRASHELVCFLKKEFSINLQTEK